MPKLINYNDFIGKKFNKLKILAINIKPNYGHTAICQCDCGNIKELTLKHILKNHTISCGCTHKRGRPKKYEIINKRIYHIWNGMINRCKVNVYYTKKNIEVCSEWEISYKTFEKWALENGYEDNLTIDRINGNGNYEPNNCRWVNNHIQTANTCICKRNTSGYKGVSFQISENKWRSDITVNGKRHFLGLYKNKEDAYEARLNYIKENKLYEYKY